MHGLSLAYSSLAYSSLACSSVMCTGSGQWSHAKELSNNSEFLQKCAAAAFYSACLQYAHSPCAFSTDIVSKQAYTQLLLLQCFLIQTAWEHPGSINTALPLFRWSSLFPFCFDPHGHVRSMTFKNQCIMQFTLRVMRQSFPIWLHCIEFEMRLGVRH